MAEGFERRGNIVQRVRLYGVFNGPCGTLHAGAQVAVSGDTVQLSKLAFGVDQRLASGLDGLLCFSARLRLRALPMGEWSLVLMSTAICALVCPGVVSARWARQEPWSVRRASAAVSSFMPRTEMEIPAISSEERNVPAYIRSTVNPLLSRKGTARRATIASSISVVAPRLLIITATRFSSQTFRASGFQ